MKPAELKILINECVREVMNEEKATKKKAALKKIQEIISENELSDDDLEEGLFSKSKPATPEEINAYLAAKPKLKAHLDKTNTTEDWKKEVAKAEYGDRIRKKETIIVKKGDSNTSFGGGLF